MPRASRHTNPRRRRSPARTALTVIGTLALLAVLGGGVYVYFAGWSSLLGDRTAPVHEENFHESVKTVEFVPDGSAEENLPYFRKVLEDYATGDGAIRGEPVVDAVVEAGFDAAKMQVSFDRTETNLVADNIFVSVLVGEDCLVGQLTTGDRSAFAAVEPAVGPDQDVCLIGETRPIDW